MSACSTLCPSLYVVGRASEGDTEITIPNPFNLLRGGFIDSVFGRSNGNVADDNNDSKPEED